MNRISAEENVKSIDKINLVLINDQNQDIILKI